MLTPEEIAAQQAQEELAAAGAPPTEKPVDWQAKFHGMKGEALKQKGLAETNAAKVLELQNSLAGKDVEVTTVKTTLQTERDTLATQNQSLQSQLNGFMKRSSLRTLIGTEYKELSTLYDDDDSLLLLQGLDDDKLKVVLGKQKEKLAGFATAAAQTQSETFNLGRTPAQPPANSRQPASTSMVEAQNALDTATSVHGWDSPERQKAFDAYMAVVKSASS